MIPQAFAQDNATDSMSVDSDSSVLAGSNDIYFDCNASNDHGRGTQDDPYRELRDGRILDDSVIHLNDGEYEYLPQNAHSNVSIIGHDASKTVVNGNGATLTVSKRLTLTNVTICNLNILNQGNLIATNTLFVNSSSDSGYGGAVCCEDNTNNVYLTNCTFINNHADIGGAVYLKGGVLEISDCTFINSTSDSFGGAIACEPSGSRKSKVTIKRSRFIGDISTGDAGGAVYLKEATLTGEDLNISSCYATFGSAFTFLKSDVKLNRIYACNNTAKYDGGAIYQMYGNLTIRNSVLLQNHARNGGGMFLDNVSSRIEGNVFSNNMADLLAGACYMVSNRNVRLNNNTCLNNTASECSDIFRLDNSSMIFTRTNYTLYSSVFEDYPIPSRYSSITEGYVTDVKDQNKGGNCWAFAALGALESSLLKASGEEIILSEENMKNLASMYSRYGWKMNTNEGGYDDMSIGYLVSWLGPILESDDSYSTQSVLSPVLESIIHVQNMVYLSRSSFTDNDEFKRAIMNCGGVYAGICMMAHYDYQIGEYVQYCSTPSPICDHAVVLVGWDDSFYVPGAPGRGAWIAKNSWGENWGRNGYFYISYYDTSCPKLNDDSAFAFILNDTIKYDKNYQYDAAKTDYFLNTTKTVWYKNIFTATDDEYLAAVSTYFEKATIWEFSIHVNGALKSVKSGKSNPGYYTLSLDEFVPLTAGDVFDAVFKITVDGDAGVPISEIVTLNNYFYHENISFISYDGKRWRDLFDIVWKYPDHIYNSQVACIKAFTILNPINATLTLTIENRTSTTADLMASVMNQWGYPVCAGSVTISYGDETYALKLTDGVARLHVALKNANLTAAFSAIGYVSDNVSCEIRNPLVNTTITLNITDNHNPLNITAIVLDFEGNPVKSGFVTFEVEGTEYKREVVDGISKLENVNVLPSKLNVTAYFSDSFSYCSSSAAKSIEISLIKTRVYLNVTSNEANNPVSVTAHVLDMDNNTVNGGSVMFLVSDEYYIVDVVNGTASVFHTFSGTGNKRIHAYYYDSYVYDSSECNETLLVSKLKVNLTLDVKIDECSAIFAIGIENSTRGFRIILNINNRPYSYTSTEGKVLGEIKDLANGTYNYTIELVSSIYDADVLRGQFNIVHKKTQISASNADLYYNQDYSVVLKDNAGKVISDRDVYITVNGKTYKSRTDAKGIATFNIPLGSGRHRATVSFIGDDEYVPSKVTVTLSFKSTVVSSSARCAVNSDYKVTLLDSDGNPLANRQVTVIFDKTSHTLAADGKGVISLNVGSNAGKHSLKLTNPSTGEVKTLSVEVIKRITGNSPLTMYYGAGKAYKVRVCDDGGNYVGNIKVKFTLKGKSYFRYTNSKGYASFKITLKPGDYKISAECKGYKVSDKIKVKSTIITKNIKVKKGKAIKFRAKLLNKKGKILKNKKVTFKFKSKTYKIKTSRKGIALLKITKKYRKGKYSIETSYGKLKIKNSIKIR
jgi:C1A family cysteine protease